MSMIKKKKILLISVSAGAGHVRAADAIKKTTESNYPEFEVLHIDFLDYIPKTIKKLFFDWYELVAKHSPQLYGFLYRQTNRPQIKKIAIKLTELLSKINAKDFLNHIVECNPDYIVCTFFIPADIIAHARDEYTIKAPLATLVTDYGIHDFWITSKEQTYFVATKEMKEEILKKDIEATQVVVSGIPIDPIFFEKKSTNDLKEKYRVSKDKKIILLLAGGKGLMKSEQVANILFELDEPVIIIAIAGKNKTLETSLKSLDVPTHHELQIIGWTDRIDEYMRIADLIITKSGGMSTTECITTGKPCIIVNPIPGQEEANAKYILDKKYGKVVVDPDNILLYTRELLETKQRTEIPNLPRGATNILEYIKKEL